jgi:hypothetical protein
MSEVLHMVEVWLIVTDVEIDAKNEMAIWTSSRDSLLLPKEAVTTVSDRFLFPATLMQP